MGEREKTGEGGWLPARSPITPARRAGQVRRWGGVWSSLLYLLPLLFLGLFFFYPLAAIMVESFAPAGQLDLSPLAALWRDPYFGRVLWFTSWQAASVHPGDPVGRDAGCLCLCPLSVPGQKPAPGPDDDPLRHADRRRSGRVHRPARPARLAEQPAGRLVRAQPGTGQAREHHLADPAGARLLQYHRHRAPGRRVLGQSRSQVGPGRQGPGRQPAARVLGDHPASADARHHRRRAAGVPLLFHQLRRDPDPGWPALRHPGSRDLPADRQSLQAAPGRSHQPGPDRRHLRGHGGLYTRARRAWRRP